MAAAAASSPYIGASSPSSPVISVTYVPASTRSGAYAVTPRAATRSTLPLTPQRQSATVLSQAHASRPLAPTLSAHGLPDARHLVSAGVSTCIVHSPGSSDHLQPPGTLLGQSPSTPHGHEKLLASPGVAACLLPSSEDGGGPPRPERRLSLSPPQPGVPSAQSSPGLLEGLEREEGSLRPSRRRPSASPLPGPATAAGLPQAGSEKGLHRARGSGSQSPIRATSPSAPASWEVAAATPLRKGGYPQASSPALTPYGTDLDVPLVRPAAAPAPTKASSPVTARAFLEEIGAWSAPPLRSQGEIATTPRGKSAKAVAAAQGRRESSDVRQESRDPPPLDRSGVLLVRTKSHSPVRPRRGEALAAAGSSSRLVLGTPGLRRGRRNSGSPSRASVAVPETKVYDIATPEQVTRPTRSMEMAFQSQLGALRSEIGRMQSRAQCVEQQIAKYRSESDRLLLPASDRSDAKV
mmetsp:Transcript_43216/g.97443  ORF Transcript_43216/g.97443 Transcript_43216/m.97443 type:complete len:466 (+) Transcript_43216:62-1459(+)